MKRFVFPILFLGVVVLVFFLTFAPTTQMTQSPATSLVGLETIIPTTTLPATLPPSSSTAEPLPTLPTISPTQVPPRLFAPVDQEYFREYLRGAGVEDCIKINSQKIWDACFDANKLGERDWQYHIIAYEKESYMRNYVVPENVSSTAGWLIGPVDQPWPLKYSGDNIGLEKLNAVFTCAIVSGYGISPQWEKPSGAEHFMKWRDLRINALVPISKDVFEKLLRFSPALNKFPGVGYSASTVRECGEIISTYMP